jgi:hypothetical protein
MKTAFLLAVGLLTCASALASGLSQLTLALSTPGPDTYADGTPVAVGETYLLVYVRAGATFRGVCTDGTLVDSASNLIVAAGSAGAGAKCGFKAVQYPSALCPAGGSWVIVLLDTRDASGAVGGLVAAQGVSAASAAASGDSTKLNALCVSTNSDGSAAALSATSTAAVPADTPVPVIAAVERGNGSACIRLGNVSGKALYEVQSTTDLSSGLWTAANGGKRVQATAKNVVKGSSGDELPVTLEVPVNDTVRFFKVVVPGRSQGEK